MEAKATVNLRIVEAKVNRYFNRMQQIFESRTSLDSRTKLKAFQRQSLEIDHIYENFEKAFEEGVRIQAEAKADFVPDYKRLDKFEEMYYEIKDLLKVVEKDRSPEMKPSTSVEARPRLPKIDLMEFDGDPMKWPMFFQTFKHLVHENPTLDPVTKLHYLMGKLKGKALSECAGIIPTANNYTVAWEALVRRYEDKRALAKAYLGQILDNKPMVQENVEQLSTFIDRVDAAVRSLRQLQIGDLGDFILTSICLSKIDTQTRVLFERSLERHRFPTFDQLADFVKEHCQILSRSSEGSAKLSSRTGKTTTWKSFTVRERSGVREKFSTVCDFCKGDSHSLYKCPKFAGLPYMTRKRFVFKKALCFNCLRSGHSGAECQSSFTCSHCKARHHTLLHKEDPRLNDEKVGSNSEVVSVSMVSTEDKAERKQTVLLSTASVWVNSKGRGRATMRVLLDSGSQCNFVTKDFCRRLRLPIKPVVASVSGIGSDAKRVKGRVAVSFRSRFQPDAYEMNAWVIDKITDNLPGVEVDTEIYQLLKGRNLADESLTTPGPIDGLIGAELVPRLLGPVQALGDGWPATIESPLGVLVVGSAPVQRDSEEFQVFCCTGLNELLQKFWELEEIAETPALSTDEATCEKLFTETVQRENDGRYVVALPFQDYPPDLGDSYSMARKRFLSLERKFSRWPEYGIQYKAVMQDYINQGHMRQVKSANEHQGYYIPHHGILKTSSTSTPLRVVFDASAASSNGKSLNDTLFVGPKLQTDIFNLLLRFRIWAIAMTADVKQMYRQIGVCEKHRPFQQVLWRFNSEEPIQTYELSTVTFGIKSSPYLALRTVKQLSVDEARKFPSAAHRVESELYMDDVVSSVADMSGALELYHQWVGLFRAGGFNLTKWATNSRALLEEIPPEGRRIDNVTFSTEMLTVLGLRWFPESDELRFKVEMQRVEWNKRSVLSTMARMWDPLGFLTPVTVAVKLFVKKLWSLKLDWDEALPLEASEMWQGFIKELDGLNNFKLPRHIGVFPGDTVRLVSFADASEKAFAAVVYLLVGGDGETRMSRLICAKAKVAPTKFLSIPRLELCGALLLAKLLKKALETIQGTLEVSDVYAFTDSTVVLHWLRGDPYRWKTFVANRVAKIKECLPGVSWHHVRSEDNPADCASRGLSPDKFVENTLWLEGPKWLVRPPNYWPLDLSTFEGEAVDLEEKVEQCLVTTVAEEPLARLIEKGSSWNKILRIMIYILRFVGRLSRGGTITVSDYAAAEKTLIKFVQGVHFTDLIKKLKTNQLVEKKIRVLTPFLAEGIIRVGGRLRNASWKFEQQHPILLPKESKLSVLLIDYIHVTHLHAGPTLVDACLRRKYWILGARDLIRRQFHRCVRCFRCKPTLTHPMMADLTPARVSEVKPFAHTGVDFAGPFKITLSRHRGVKATKGYFCIFNCLTTRAIHLEAASDLSTDCCLAAIQRFLARRGPCAVFYSDQGTNFVGVKRRLNELEEFLASDALKEGLQREFTHRRIEWRFNPPAAPHFGGAWEAGVKSVKYHLYRVVGEQVLTFEEFTTLLCEIEAVLNSRPLGWLSSDPSDPVALTPAHFLTLSPLQEIPSSNFESSLRPLQRKALIDQMVQSYWSRWRQEYLSTLQKKMKWNTPACPVQPGVMVVIHQENVPPLSWPLGRIQEVYPGRDGVLRVALVKTKSGLFKRPLVKLAPLPVY